MAINIFQGAQAKSKNVNSASASQRAQAAKSALTGASETSNSGGTAVKTQGTLAKVGDFVGKAAGIASKFLPGIGGTIAQGVANLFNDPEWWQSVPGDAITLNVPLALTEEGSTYDHFNNRPVFAEFVTDYASWNDNTFVFDPDTTMVSQYLLPEIRKVVNAVPLQPAAQYREVLRCNATIYALWRNLLRYDYLLKHGQTYLPNFDVSHFPVLQVENAAWLQSTINRLEEHLRASVRLPHTLCEYLAWRFGRIYKSTDSAKAGLILYNVRPIGSPIADLNTIISQLLAFCSGTTDRQKANADMYNAYYDHDLAVVIADDTQFKFDKKEFMLRTNCDLIGGDVAQETSNLVFIDSSLDNPTTFMASTVSTVGASVAGAQTVLFPLTRIYIYALWSVTAIKDQLDAGGGLSVGDPSIYGTQSVASYLGSGWVRAVIERKVSITQADAIMQNLFMRPLDIYNKDSFVPIYVGAYPVFDVELGSLSMDAGLVSDQVLGNEHVYAFANLVHIDRKHSTSYAKAEKLVAKDVANMVEKLDVASVVPTTVVK